MIEPKIRFDDGAAYEQMMGIWSRRAGEIFLNWLEPPSGLRWIDIGCGNGAFTELLVERCGPVEVQGIDPSESTARFCTHTAGGAAGRVSAGRCDGGSVHRKQVRRSRDGVGPVFVPDPAQGIAEMVRIVAPG